jgi:iron complex transport system substrate-binding protein
MLAAILCIAHAPAQSRAKQNTTPVSQPTFKTVRDETGRSVRIPVPVRRIVSLSPSSTETLYALGMDDLLVGDTDYCDYPPAATKKHKVGGATNPSIEEIATLHPDVVLVTKLNRVETVEQLERLGIASYATDPHSVDEIRSSVRRLADVLGNPTAGESLDAELQRKETELQQRLQNVTRKRVLFLVWTDPLISVGRHTFIADALDHAGAISVVDSSQDWPQMSLEEMVRLQPDTLVFAS